MDFPITDLMDPDACYPLLVRTLHPDGLRCPRCQRAGDHPVHDRHRSPVLDYRCRGCVAVFNAYTPLQQTHRPPVHLVFILRGIGQGTPTARLARERGCDRKHRLPDVGRRHAAVGHTPGQREWPRDDDGDGVREVHDNTLEGLWAALRPFRGVSKHYLGQYVAVFEWVANLKAAVPVALRRLRGLTTSSAP